MPDDPADEARMSEQDILAQPPAIWLAVEQLIRQSYPQTTKAALDRQFHTLMRGYGWLRYPMIASLEALGVPVGRFFTAARAAASRK